MYQKPLVTIELEEYLATQKYMLLLEEMNNPYKKALEDLASNLFIPKSPSISHSLRTLPTNETNPAETLRNIMIGNGISFEKVEDRVKISIRK